MKDAGTIERYLRDYGHPYAANTWPFGALSVDHVVVVPAYDESRDFIDRATAHTAGPSWLLIVNVNAPQDATADCARRTHALLDIELSDEWERRPCERGRAWQSTTHRRAVWLLDCVTPARRLPVDQGVGLARKIGLDTALAQIALGHIEHQLMYCSDADARWPERYFEPPARPGVSALTFGFRHRGERAHEPAQVVYDKRLRDYPRALQHAGSPYGFQALGSAMAVSATHYAQVRGCPRRPAGEDFHLLAKLAKVGQIEHRPDQIVELQARLSTRVPFGTGPGVRQLASSGDPYDVPMFYACESFAFLAAILDALRTAVTQNHSGHQFESELGVIANNMDLPGNWRDLVEFDAMRKALNTACDSTSITARRERHIMVWFDALRTLRLMHRLRDAGWANLSYRELQQAPERFSRSETTN